MKKFFLLCTLFALLAALSAAAVTTYTVPTDDFARHNDFIYKIEEDHVVLIGYEGSKYDIAIPETIEGLPVTEIRRFRGIDKNAEPEIVRPSSSTAPSIGNFSSGALIVMEVKSPVSRIQSIFIPKTVTKIGEGAFAHLESLRELTVDAENPVYHAKGNCIVETESGTVISGCLASHIPDTAKRIGETAFWGCAIKSVTVPEGVTEIGTFAFQGCKKLTTVKLPTSLTDIGAYAFSGCTALPRLTIPKGVREIGHGAFEDCTALSALLVHEENPVFYTEARCILTKEDKRVIAAGWYATLPKDFTAVEDHAFSGMLSEYVEELTLPETLTRIGSYAFAGGSFSKVVIPASVTEIEPTSFTQCYSLKTITVAEENPRYYSENGCLIDREQKAVIAFTRTKIVIPDGVTAIAENAFYGYSGSTIGIPASVTDIGEYAFTSYNAMEVDYGGSPIMWSVLPRLETGLEEVKVDCKGKDADTLAAADFDGDGTVRLKDALLAMAEMQNGKDINGDGVFDEADARWIALLCTAQ